MCRNTRVLHHFEPPTTLEEIRAAAEQFVRKVSGVRTPAKADVAEALGSSRSRPISSIQRGCPWMPRRWRGRGKIPARS